MSRDVFKVLLPGVSLAALAMLQPWLEQRMFTHMIVELPLLFAIGWWMAPKTLGKGPAWFQGINAYGLMGLSMAMAISMAWMVPLALDAAVLEPGVGWLKVVSVVLSGGLTRLSLRASPLGAQGFFIINWAWMTATAGVLYQEAPQRLCSTYLLGDQAWTGTGLVALSVGVISTWIVLAFRPEPEDKPNEGGHKHPSRTRQAKQA